MGERRRVRPGFPTLLGGSGVRESAEWSRLCRCFLLPLKRQYLDLPYLARESELETLKLPAERKVDYMRCHEAVYDQVGRFRPSTTTWTNSRSSLSARRTRACSSQTTANRSCCTRRPVGLPTFVARFTSSMQGDLLAVSQMSIVG